MTPADPTRAPGTRPFANWAAVGVLLATGAALFATLNNPKAHAVLPAGAAASVVVPAELVPTPASAALNDSVPSAEDVFRTGPRPLAEVQSPTF